MATIIIIHKIYLHAILRIDIHRTSPPPERPSVISDRDWPVNNREDMAMIKGRRMTLARHLGSDKRLMIKPTVMRIKVRVAGEEFLFGVMMAMVPHMVSSLPQMHPRCWGPPPEVVDLLSTMTTAATFLTTLTRRVKGGTTNINTSPVPIINNTPGALLIRRIILIRRNHIMRNIKVMLIM